MIQWVITEHGSREYRENRCPFGSRSRRGEVTGATMLCAGNFWIVGDGTRHVIIIIVNGRELWQRPYTSASQHEGTSICLILKSGWILRRAGGAPCIVSERDSKQKVMGCCEITDNSKNMRATKDNNLQRLTGDVVVAHCRRRVLSYSQ